jgi:hypothetical protein
MASTDLFQQRASECRRLAAAARKGSDRAFWLGLVERWQAWKVERRNDIAYDKAPLRTTCKSVAPAGEVRQPGLVQPTQNDILSH